MSDVAEQVRAALGDVLPALAMDGVGVEVLGADGGVVQVRLSRTCTSCPSSVRAVIVGLEEELTRRVPGVRYLEAVV